MTELTSRERLLAALEGRIPDRLPVTTHHVMPSFLKNLSAEINVENITDQQFFDYFKLDPVLWITAHKPDESQGAYFDLDQPDTGTTDPKCICSDDWQISRRVLPDAQYVTTLFRINTPRKTLTMMLQGNAQTDWVAEPLLKEKADIDLIVEYAPAPLCDVSEANNRIEEFGNRGISRGTVPGFDIYGQPGCWQDAAVLFGIENLIMETFIDPEWVHTFLKILFDRKLKFIESMKGANFDLVELGGGSASSTVISPSIFDNFVAPYDSALIEAAHKAGQRIVYHTCGGMMPILESIADMNPDAIETFTPKSMGGDANLAEAKRRIGDRVCMIGGFDQFHYLKDCSPDKTREAVRRCFEEAGAGGGFILAPSDHFFEADTECLRAFADEGRKCVY